MRFAFRLGGRVAGVVFGVAVATASPGWSAPPAGVSSDLYARPGRLVPVDGARRLNLVCLGRGSPTVVLEAGAGDSAAVWRKVQPQVARRTRVCAYDRAGYGFSDPSVRASDPRQAVTDLHALLLGAGVRGPIVLVGHSLGGLYAELFVATYAPEVAGLVLVDPTGLDDFGFGRQIMTDDERERFGANHVKRLAGYERCLELARAGKLSTSPPPECKPDLTGERALDEAVARQFARPAYWTAYQSEMMNFYSDDYPAGVDSETTRQVRARPMRPGTMPIVLLMTLGQVPPGERGKRLRAASTAAAQRLVETSTRGRVVRVASGHYVHVEQPQAVVDAIGEVLNAIRP